MLKSCSSRSNIIYGPGHGWAVPGIKLRVLMSWDVPFVMTPGIKPSVLMSWGYGRHHTACADELFAPSHLFVYTRPFSTRGPSARASTTVDAYATRV